jgi:hypothetical protein
MINVIKNLPFVLVWGSLEEVTGSSFVVAIYPVLKEPEPVYCKVL